MERAQGGTEYDKVYGGIVMAGQGKTTDHQLQLTIEKRKNVQRQIASYRSIISHLVGIVTAIAEIHLNQKVTLEKPKKDRY